jgi:hypothetical protein
MPRRRARLAHSDATQIVGPVVAVGSGRLRGDGCTVRVAVRELGGPPARIRGRCTSPAATGSRPSPRRGPSGRPGPRAARPPAAARLLRRVPAMARRGEPGQFPGRFRAGADPASLHLSRQDLSHRIGRLERDPGRQPFVRGGCASCPGPRTSERRAGRRHHRGTGAAGEAVTVPAKGFRHLGKTATGLSILAQLDVPMPVCRGDCLLPKRFSGPRLSFMST